MNRTITPAALILAVLCTTATSRAYEPFLPKVGTEPDTVIMLDFAQDNHNALMGTITCLQGLINREAAKKPAGQRLFVYIKHLPCRFYNMEDALDGGEEAIKRHNMIPYPKKTPSIDKTQKHPTLAYLMQTYQHLVSGYVLSPRGNFETGGAQAAAVNYCIFEGSSQAGFPLYVEEYALDYLRSLGYDLPVQLNMVSKNFSNEQAFDWSIEQGYLDDPRRNRRLAIFGGSYYNNSLDYSIATYSYNYCLYKESAVRDSLPIDSRYAQLKDRFDPGALHLGPIEGGHGLQQVQKQGHVGTPSTIPNLSVFSAMPVQPENFQRPPAPEEHLPVDLDGLYIAWQNHDGDAMDVATFGAIRTMLQLSPDQIRVPVARKATPFVIDLFPTLFAALSEHCPERLEISPSLADGGFPYTDEGVQAYHDIYKHYMLQDNDVYNSFHYMGFNPVNVDQVMGDLPIPYWFMGYSGPPEATTFYLWENTLYSNFTLHRDTPPDSSLKVIQAIARDESFDGKPIFLLLRENWNYQEILDLHDLLQNDATIAGLGRNLHFLLPRDLAATYKAWHHGCRKELWKEDFETGSGLTDATQSTTSLPGNSSGTIGLYRKDGSGSTRLEAKTGGTLDFPSTAWEIRVSCRIAAASDNVGDLSVRGFARFADENGNSIDQGNSKKRYLKDIAENRFADFSREIEIPEGADHITSAGLIVMGETGGYDIHLDDMRIEALDTYNPDKVAVRPHTGPSRATTPAAHTAAPKARLLMGSRLDKLNNGQSALYQVNGKRLNPRRLTGNSVTGATTAKGVYIVRPLKPESHRRDSGVQR